LIVRNFFIPISYLCQAFCQLLWPPWCRARKCKHFATLTVWSPIWRWQ